MPLADAQSESDLPGRIVGAADVTHLALSHQAVERFERFVLRSIGVGRVSLVEIDVIGLQAAQAVLGGFQDVLAGQPFVIGSVADAHAALGGQDEFFPFPTKPTANDFFTLPRGFGRGRDRINIGSINEGDAPVGGLIENGGRGALVTLVAEGHGAQADFRDL